MKIIYKLFSSILIIFLILVTYLTIIGIETDRFNNQIESKIKNIDEKIEVELKKIKLVLDPFKFKINAKTFGSKFINENGTVEIESIKTQLSLKALIKNEFGISIKGYVIPEYTNKVTGHTAEIARNTSPNRVTFGMEHGNEKFRRDVVKRSYTNELAIKLMKVPDELDIPFSVNNIIGFPGETRELAFDTIELNRNIGSDNANIHTFVPFHGTPLRKMCEDLGLIKPETITRCLTAESQLVMPQYPPEEIEAIKKCFTLYVKFPKNRWKEIERAEKNDNEGNRIYKELKAEYLEKFMPKPDADPHSLSTEPRDFSKVENPYFGDTRNSNKSLVDEMN